MRKLGCLLLLLPVTIFGQERFHLNLFGGFSNYSGDLQAKQFTLDQAKAAVGVGLSYTLMPHLDLRAGLAYGKISADDKSNPPSLRPRNLNFRSSLWEGSLLLEYSLFSLDDRRFTPYAFGGLALFHFDPYTYDSLGVKYYLQPLGTEGQGLAQYPDRKMYSLTQFALPFGAGIRLRMTDRVSLGYEIGFRKTFTDYVDDVSRTYADPAALLQLRGSKAVELAYRGGELKNGDPNYPAEGTIRGGSKYKDWYYFQGITLRIGLGNGAGFGGRRGSIDCPKDVR